VMAVLGLTLIIAGNLLVMRRATPAG
jgi:hypothetical protein